MNDLQKCILDIYIEIKKICDKHNITYYGIGGTCIGAVRHRGFIPWDDDLDIAIPIEEYQCFKAAVEAELPPHYKLFTCANGQHFPHVFYKIYDCRTTFIELLYYSYPETYKGVFVDVFPLSGLPANRLARALFMKKVRFYQILNYYNRFFESNIKIKGKLKFIKRLLKVFLREKFPINYFSDILIDLLGKYPVSEMGDGDSVWFFHETKLIFGKRSFSGVVEFDFENTKMFIPAGYDRYLTEHFGNYMQFPPQEEQKPHHLGLIDLKNSYEKYQRNPQLVTSYVVSHFKSRVVK